MINFKPKKLLLVFELSHTLLYIKNTKTRSLQLPSTKPITYHESLFNDHYKVSYRKGRQQFFDYFFREQQKNIDIAVWSNLNHEFTQTLIKKYFSRYFRHLLFVMATDRSLYGAHKQLQTNIKIKRELGRIYSNFPGYTERNTLIVSSQENLIQDYKKNDVLVPEYCPTSSMWEVDPGMHPFIKYMRGVVETQKTYNLVDIRSMIAAKNLASMFKRLSHNIYSDRQYN